jgi:GDP-L-fucose synthase
MEKAAKIYIAGHRGMVGSAIFRKLQKEGFSNLLTRTSSELDLRDQKAVTDFFQKKSRIMYFLLRQRLGE